MVVKMVVDWVDSMDANLDCMMVVKKDVEKVASMASRRVVLTVVSKAHSLADLMDALMVASMVVSMALKLAVPMAVHSAAR